jgi:hypothetical protein
LSVDFEEWWKAYPHKVGKGAARKAYQKASGPNVIGLIKPNPLPSPAPGFQVTSKAFRTSR